MIKYGLYCYDTENIGDEIQSIAARRFLPRIDYYFNRDDIDATKVKDGDTVKLIMNGWYTHKPELWPPKAENINPLLISMFVEQAAGVDYSAEVFASEKSVNFLNKFGPVGARDKSSADFFNNIGVESYFSGCLTLTLIADSRVKKQDFILAVDVSDKIYQKIKASTDRNIVRLNTCRLTNLGRDEKFKIAEYWLFLYQSAHMVITPRLHCMLPCLALETPVLAISGRDPKRYNGLIELTNHIDEKTFLSKDFSYNFDAPKSNPVDYKKIREDIISTCSKYTGFDSKSSYISNTTPEELLFDTSLLNAFGESIASGFELDELKKSFVFLQSENADLKKRIEQLESERNTLSAEVDNLKNIGIKGATKQLLKANKALIKKSFSKKN